MSTSTLAADKIDDGTPVNLGTMERTRVIDAVSEVSRRAPLDDRLVLLDERSPAGERNFGPTLDGEVTSKG
jgi:hypothetical protein